VPTLPVCRLFRIFSRADFDVCPQRVHILHRCKRRTVSPGRADPLERKSKKIWSQTRMSKGGSLTSPTSPSYVLGHGSSLRCHLNHREIRHVHCRSPSHGRTPLPCRPEVVAAIRYRCGRSSTSSEVETKTPRCQTFRAYVFRVCC